MHTRAENDNIEGTIAVIDSGVGGLSVLRELRPMLPLNSILYYADSASCPYGGRTMQEIVELTQGVVRFVVERGAKVVVVACNTMTAAAIGVMRTRWQGVDFVGMEPAIKPAAQVTKSGVVGVLATTATLSGGLYNSTKIKYASEIEVVEVAGVGLVEFVEQGQQDSPECEVLLEGYIDEMLTQGCDTVVLGCTHYPFLEGAIRRILLRKGQEMAIVNPAPAVAHQALRVIEKRGLVERDMAKQGAVHYFSSGGDINIINNGWK